MTLAESVYVSPELDAWLRETRRMIHVQPEIMLEERRGVLAVPEGTPLVDVEIDVADADSHAREATPPA